MWKFILASFFIWRIGLLIVVWSGSPFIPQRLGFLGPSVWSNFDGIHYLSIAQNGYMRYQEAFFPLYPLLIRFLAKIVFLGNYLWAGLFISHLSFFTALIIFYKLVRMEFSQNVAKIAILGLLVFPTSLFFGVIYTESLFLLLILASFYAAKKERWFWVGIFGGLASATRLVGIFLLPALLWEWHRSKFKIQKLKVKKQFSNPIWLFLIPMGLVSYMVYLNNFVGDPLAFIHAQPAFGAQRTGGEIVLLPQVYWRYLRIFLTVPFSNYDFWIALFEFVVFNAALIALWFAWKRKIDTSYLIFSILAFIGPTLTGTFSSIPRYAIVSFPVFIAYGLIKNKKVLGGILVTSTLLMIFLAALFTRGYFTA